MTRDEWPADSRAPAAARAFVADVLRHSLTPGATPTLDEVVLVTSELVTNAVRAQAQTVTVDVFVDKERIDLVVSDDAGGWPAVRHVGSDALGGRGLAIVEQLAETWTTRPHGAGKAVTASWPVPRSGPS